MDFSFPEIACSGQAINILQKETKRDNMKGGKKGEESGDRVQESSWKMNVWT